MVLVLNEKIFHGFPTTTQLFHQFLVFDLQETEKKFLEEEAEGGEFFL